MIIRRYLIKEVIKAQCAILFVLLVIFISQKLIKILSSSVSGDIPIDLIFSLLMLGLSDMFNLILPLSLYLGILIAFVRLYNDSEMGVMYACGMKKKLIYQSVAVVAIITCLLTVTNVAYYGPWSSKEESLTLQNAKKNPNAAGILSGQFQILESSNSVIYIGSVEKNQLFDIFIYQNGPVQSSKVQTTKSSIILANKGQVTQDKEGNQIIQLEEANRYEGESINNEIRVNNFTNYQAIIIPKALEEIDNTNEKQMNFKHLVKKHDQQSKAELWWRLTLIISSPLLAFLVIPLSVSNPRHGKFSQILPAILLYLIYYLAMSSFKANGYKGKINPEFWIIATNIMYFILAVLFNLWDTTWMRKLRYRFADHFTA